MANMRKLLQFLRQLIRVLALCGIAGIAHAADNEIIIIIGDEGWCDGVGQEVIYTPEGELNDCGCSDGFDQLDPPDENGEPLCGYDFGSDTPGPDGDGSGPGDPPSGGGDDAPDAPTLAQCQQMNTQCLRDATNLTQQCRDNRTRFNHNQLANGEACHDQSLDDLLDGFRYRVAWLTIACTREDFFDITSTYTDNCRRQAIRRGMDRCQWGIDARSQSNGSSSTDTITFKSPIFSVSGSGTRTTTLSVTTPFGMGSNQACMAMGTKAVDQCTADLNTCTAEAEAGTTPTPQIVTPGATTDTTATMSTGTQPVAAGQGSSGPQIANVDQPLATDAPDTLAPLSLNERLRSQVDRARLGLLDDNVAPSTRLYRALPRQRLEIPALYTERLWFLANWSHFLRRNAVPDVAMRAMETALRAEQFAVQSEFQTETGIVEAVFAVDMRTGAVGSDALRDLLTMYRARGGVRRQMVTGQARVQVAAKEVFGETLGSEFMDTVWPGMLTFGFASPFELRLGVRPVEGGELAPTGPVNQ